MEPTLMGNHNSPGDSGQGDHIFVNKWSYRFEPPKRGDIAVFRTAGIEQSRRESFRIPEGQYHIKRVVGLPGERISIRAPYVYINGRELLEPKIFETIASATNGYHGFTNGWGTAAISEIVLGSDEYFVLGDNTQNSLDSRYYGPIRRKFFIGKIGWIYWPPERRSFPQ